MSNRQHPYRDREGRSFWGGTVKDVDPLAISEWYRRKFEIDPTDRVATAGSCFAQHIGRELKKNGFTYLDVEPPPPLLARQHWPEFGYGIYSARYGNVYTPRQLLQLAQRALGEFEPQDVAWEKDEGFVDPFRPTLEPEPFSSTEEVEALSRDHLSRVVSLFERTDIFVFTLGLTECWVANADGAVFPVAPGVSGGSYEEDRYGFLNLSYEHCKRDLSRFIQMMRSINGEMHFLFTVSPVPLMATASDQQVIVATSYSKSVLRAIAGRLAERLPYVDYFPSYEIISSHVMGGRFYQPDKRGVEQVGVEHVMRQFFAEHPPPKASAAAASVATPGVATPSAAAVEADAHKEDESDEDVVCDEELLAAFGERSAR